MLADVFATHGKPLDVVVREACAFLRSRQQSDGSVVDAGAEKIEESVFRTWDTVNATKECAAWKTHVDGLALVAFEKALSFLAANEKPTGMLTWGPIEIGPSYYCTETSSEYITMLSRLSKLDLARQKAQFLRSRQLPSGPWEEVHPHIPKAFQVVPSVTAFALQALGAVDMTPLYLDESLDFIVRSQQASGHFGVNWYFYNTPYYVTRPVSEIIHRYGCYSSVKRLRDYVLSQQSRDGSWHTELERFGRSASRELHSALALETLAHTGIGADDKRVGRGLIWLLGQQRSDGSWSGGDYPYPDAAVYQNFEVTQDVTTTSFVLSAIRTFLRLEQCI